MKLLWTIISRFALKFYPLYKTQTSKKKDGWFNLCIQISDVVSVYSVVNAAYVPSTF